MKLTTSEGICILQFLGTLKRGLETEIDGQGSRRRRHCFVRPSLSGRRMTQSLGQCLKTHSLSLTEIR
jgi:hypothetical protein